MDDVEKPIRVDPSVPAALQKWREAERAVAVARRGKVAAEAASEAAAAAAAAANDTAEAARRALDAATMAEASAVRTSIAAKLAVSTTLADSADAAADLEIAEATEQLAHRSYSDAVRDHAERQG